MRLCEVVQIHLPRMDSEILHRLNRITESITKLDKQFQEHIQDQQSKHILMEQKMYIIISKMNKIESIESANLSITSNLACIQENMEEVVRKVDRMETSLNETLKHGQDEVKKSLEDFKTETKTDLTSLNDSLRNTLENIEFTIKSEDARTLVETRGCVNNLKKASVNRNDVIDGVAAKITSKFALTIKDFKRYLNKFKSKSYESRNNLKYEIERTKQDIFKMTRKEAQLLRDRIERSLPFPRKYSFDLDLKDFILMKNNGHTVRSEPWYINEINIYVKGKAELITDDKISVSLELEDSTRMRLLPVTGKIQLKVKATLCDKNKIPLPSVSSGEVTWILNGDEVFKNIFTVKTSVQGNCAKWEGGIIRNYVMTIHGQMLCCEIFTI